MYHLLACGTILLSKAEPIFLSKEIKEVKVNLGIKSWFSDATRFSKRKKIFILLWISEL